MDVMRHRDIGTVNLEVERLFGLITDNPYFVTRFSGTASDGRVNTNEDYRHEMQCFVESRILFFITSLTTVVKNHFFPSEDGFSSLPPEKLKINGTMYSTGAVLSSLSNMDLQRLEFDVEHTLDIVMAAFENVADDQEDKSLSMFESYDMLSILAFLIKGIMYREYYRLGDKPNRVNIINQSSSVEADSMRSVIILGYLVAKVASVLLTLGKKEYTSPEMCRKWQMEKLSPELGKYTSLGVISLTGIICCFKYEQLLPEAVINSNRPIGGIEKEFLFDVVALSKLV